MKLKLVDVQSEVERAASRPTGRLDTTYDGVVNVLARIPYFDAPGPDQPDLSIYREPEDD